MREYADLMQQAHNPLVRRLEAENAKLRRALLTAADQVAHATAGLGANLEVIHNCTGYDDPRLNSTLAHAREWLRRLDVVVVADSRAAAAPATGAGEG